jgi:hypothetical protein
MSLAFLRGEARLGWISSLMKLTNLAWTIGDSTNGQRMSSQQAKTARDASDGPNVAPAPILA